MSRDLTIPAPSREVIRQAAKWLALWHSGEMTEGERRKLATWRASSPEHEQAWHQAEQLARKLAHIPSELGMPVLDRNERISRRDFIKPLTLLMVAMPTGILAYRHTPWQQWMADYRTATGELREVVLDDGTRILLNTASAIDVDFSGDLRQVRLLAGEILIQTAPDNARVHRPFVVDTPEGRLRALGTRFTVRQQDGVTKLAVMEGAVEASPALDISRASILHAGRQSSLSANEVHAIQPLDDKHIAWADGILYVDKMPLHAFISELGRYRPGVLRCAPEVAHLEVSGVFQLNDTDRILAALHNTLPVQLKWRTRYWVTIAGRE
ncbi:FecR domain-containing protein [Methylobacillus gramineus]|uniref:FecR domain-containing protein n=1 Tax=Methylobacillus gramineus TaxID=755169 RepID=UPI001D000332|nr:FecR domain-containing protein [Methylobacillus gramineus]MCB5185754.1 FecR domain-containing protein [Methylobacillus gramineus]